MSAPAPAVKGWCPGALRPMPTGDGLLARVRVSAGRLSLDQAEALGAAARDCGNGTIEISSRANLQLRGIREFSLDDLRRRLDRLGLIDVDATTERVRNIVASPLSDIDPASMLDVGPVVAALEARMATDEHLRALPAKFGFLIDAGGRLPLGDIDADVRFEAFVGKHGVRFAVGLGGPHPRPLNLNGEGRSADAATSPPRSYGVGSGVGSCETITLAPDDVPDIAARLAHAFFKLAGRGPEAPRRMRTLVQREGAAAVFAAAGLATETRSIERRESSPRDSVGVIAVDAQTCVGAAPPFGRTDAHAFTELARAARRNGANGLRLTPWRTIVAIGMNARSAAGFSEDLQAIGFIVARDDPRLGIVACPGAPSCAHAERDTCADASRLAASLGSAGGIVLHVSGCAKGCARASATPLTLVGSPEGYDLVVRGRVGDAPAYRGLAIGQAAVLVRKLCEGLAA
jgi:precorrin-3B synthase